MVRSKYQTANIDFQMQHLNGDVMCALYLTHTGENPRMQELLELCIYPVDNFIQPSNQVVPFYAQLIPFRPECIDRETMTSNLEDIANATIQGVDRSIAADRFEDWFNRLNLRENKKIVPLTYNWPEIREYLHTWLGHHNFKYFFSDNYRDILSMALLTNDLRNQRGEPCIFPKVNLAYVGNVYQIELSLKQDVMENCKHIADVYRRMTNRTVINH